MQKYVHVMMSGLLAAAGAPFVSASCDAPDFVEYIDGGRAGEGSLGIPFYFLFDKNDSTHNKFVLCLKNTTSYRMAVYTDPNILRPYVEVGKKYEIWDKKTTDVPKSYPIDIYLEDAAYEKQHHTCELRKALTHGWATHGWTIKCKI